MEDTTYPDPYVQKFLKNFELGKINAEVDTITAAKYGVRSYPTILLLKPDGTEIDRIVGFYPPTEFVTAIVNSMSGIGTLEDLLNRLSLRPSDLSLIYEVGQKYRYRGDYDKAAAYFNQAISLDPQNKKFIAGKSTFNMGHMKYKLKEYPDAVQFWRKLVSTYPADSNRVDAELMIAVSHQKANDFKLARAEFKQFLKDHPDYDDKDWVNEQLAKMDEQEKKKK